MTFPTEGDIKQAPEAVRVYPSGREVCNMATAAGKREYRRRVAAMLDRQNGVCCLCHQPLRLEFATFEHEYPRGMGGGSRDDRETLPDGTWINGAACWPCNAAKGSRRVAYNAGRLA